MPDATVVVAGGGPTGLTLGAELTLGGVPAVIVEPRVDEEFEGSRAGGLHARTIEIFDQRGIADRFLAEGTTYPHVSFAQIPLDLGDFPSRHNYLLGLWQRISERVLRGWVNELQVPRVAARLTGIDQDPEGVTVALSDGTSLRAAYLVGCDGGRSTVRKSAGIEFAGFDASLSWIMAEVEMDEEPPLGFQHDEVGTHVITRSQDSGALNVVLTEPTPGGDPAPTLDELRDRLRAVYGTDFGAHDPHRLSRFTDATRQAVRYRDGRVLLAGDAAHVHPPQGGQGLNIGVQDAMNLGWKLAQVAAGSSPPELLDSYQSERHPIAARVLRNTMAQVTLIRPDERHRAVHETVRELLNMDEPRRRFAGMLSGLDICYETGCPHPLAGRRMPDLDLATSAGSVRLFSLLREARPLLLHLDDAAHIDTSPWPGLRRVDAACAGPWELPVVGTVPAPQSVLVRPDGYVAWAGSAADPALTDAATRWFGRP